MPWTEQELPWRNSPSPLASQSSYQGAEDAKGRAPNQTLRLLEAYARIGQMTDAQMARLLGIERSTVNARRGELCHRGIVEAKGRVEGEHGLSNVVWGLASGTQLEVGT